MRRRELIAALGGALALPWIVHARQIVAVRDLELPTTLVPRADEVIE